MQGNPLVKQATGVSALLLGGSKPPFTGVMYLLVITTFLNQSVLNIHVGFFSLFLYRMVLIVAVILFFFHVQKEMNLLQFWHQVNVKEILLFLFFWMAYGAVSLLWAKSVLEGMKSLILLSMGISFVLLAVFTFRKMSQLFMFYGIWMFMTVILMVLGLINHFAHIQLPTSTLYGGPEYKLSYPTSVFFNQNDFATFLTISLFFYLSITKNSKQFYLRTACLFLAIICVYLIYMTDSRASLLGVMIGFIVYMFILLPRYLKRLAAIIGSAVMLMGTIVFLAKLADLLSTSTFYSSHELLPSNVARLNLLRNTLHFSLESFGFGVGAGNIPFYLKNESIYATNQVVEVHNWLAEIMGNYGILILIGYITMFAYLFIRLYKLYKARSNRSQKGLLEACMMGLIGFAVSSISPSSISNLYFHWVLLGLVISTVSVFTDKKNPSKGSKVQMGNRIQSLKERIKKYFLLLLSITILLGVIGWLLPVGKEKSNYSVEAALTLGSYNNSDLNDPKEVITLLTTAPFYEEHLKDLWEEKSTEIRTNLHVTAGPNNMINLTYSDQSEAITVKVLHEITNAFMAIDKDKFLEKKHIIQESLEAIMNAKVGPDAKVDQQRFLFELKTTDYDIKPATLLKSADMNEINTENRAFNSKERAVLGILLGVTLSFLWIVFPVLFQE